MAMLEVNNLSIQFGGLRAVDGFNMTIEKGQLYGLIGPNGAGKTTGNYQAGRTGHYRKKHHRDQQGRNRKNFPEYPSFQGYAGS